MVQGKDGMELLSTYLNRIYDQQETTNAKYARLGAINMARLSQSPRSNPTKY